jgi:hypothetical protein
VRPTKAGQEKSAGIYNIKVCVDCGERECVVERTPEKKRREGKKFLFLFMGSPSPLPPF